MLPVYIGPVLLGATAIALFVVRLKYPYATMFDISLVFYTIAIVSIISLFFYYGVVVKSEVAKAVHAVQTIIDIDPSKTLATSIKSQKQTDGITGSQYNDIKKKLDNQSLSNIKKGGPGLFMYVSSGLAVAFLALHILKNIKEKKTPLRPVEAVIFCIVTLMSAVPILVYYLIINRDPFLQKSDMAKDSLDSLKYRINKQLITIWNSDTDLRDNMDVQSDASQLAQQHSSDISELISTLNIIIPSLNNLPSDNKSNISAACNDLIISANAVISDLQNTVKSPCNASTLLESSSNKSKSTLPKLTTLASRVQALDALSRNTGRSDIDVMLENFITSCQPVISNLQKFASADHCNKRERVRAILTSLKGSCDMPEQESPSLWSRLLHNVNGVFLMVISISLFLLYINKTSRTRHYWESAAISAVSILLILFGYILSDFIASGKIKSVLDNDVDAKYFMYLLS